LAAFHEFVAGDRVVSSLPDPISTGLVPTNRVAKHIEEQ
jgi:hypothetical protein